MTSHDDFSTNNRFLVFVGPHKLSFAKVSGLGSTMNKEIYAEGGTMNSPHVMRTPNSDMRTLVMERGIQAFNFAAFRMEPGTFVPWIQVIVLGPNKKPVYEYFITEAWVSKWEDTELDAMDGKVIVNRFEVDYSSITRINLKF